MSNKYWEKREAEALKHYLKQEEDYKKYIDGIYDRSLDNIKKEIDAFYGRYADKEGITLAEAKKRVKTADIKEFERKAKKYVKDKNFSKQANEEMRLYNLMMKVNRLEMLKANIGLELISSFDEMDKFMEAILDGRTKAELERQAGILGNTIQDNAKLAHSIVNASFHNATYSDRIWMYQDLLRDEIGKQLERGLIQGKNPRVLARDLNKIFNTGKYNCERLMRTELARVQIESQKKSYEKNGFEMYTFITNTGCCDKCDAITGKHFYVKDMIPGENAPPMHPNCRCSTAPYSDRKEYDAWLEHLANGGTDDFKKFTHTEHERSKPKHKYQNTVVDIKKIISAGFRKRFDGIDGNPKVDRAIYDNVKEMLQHRSGTKYEDLAFIDAESGKSIINKSFNKENHAKPNKPMKKMLDDAVPHSIIGVHNHPSSSVPSISDIVVCMNRKYKYGIIACHDGKIYKYSVNEEKFNQTNADIGLVIMEKKGYNDRTKNILLDAGVELELL